MTKQEEIEKGLLKIFLEKAAKLKETGVVGGVGKAFMEFLHENGLVIKVDRELPKIKAVPERIFENEKDTIHTKMCYLAGIKDYQTKVKEDGYVAVESLI